MKVDPIDNNNEVLADVGFHSGGSRSAVSPLKMNVAHPEILIGVKSLSFEPVRLKTGISRPPTERVRGQTHLHSS